LVIFLIDRITDTYYNDTIIFIMSKKVFNEVLH
jgi:hypothetical protein